MDRRSIIKYAAALTGMSILSPLSVEVLASNDVNTNKPQFFSQPDFQLLTSVLDTILPKTDTPSACDVNVHYIMDNMLSRVFNTNYQVTFMKRFTSLKSYLMQKDFLLLNANQKLTVIQALENEKRKGNELFYLGYIDLKQQGVSYYLSTEEVAENHLNYLPVPGKYIPSKSVKALNGKAWAE